MIRHSTELDELEARYVRQVIGPMTYHEALEWFAALWVYAKTLDPGFPQGDWREDIEVDIAVARLLNGRGPERI
jgi:hypothetical protein